LANWKDKLQFEYLTNHSVEEILARVADLPPQSIIIYGRILKDKTGRSFNPTDVGNRVAKVANAPVFCLYDTHIGQGMVGGSLLSFDTEGSRIAKFALNILSGNIEETTAIASKPVLMFDWQQIKRWGGKTSHLPKGTIFLNTPSSLWSKYAWHITGFLLILLTLLLLIGLLLVQRRHRRRAELELRNFNVTLEQRIAERMVQLQEKEASYMSLFNSMTEGFALHEIICGVDGKPVDYRFLEINPAFERLTGLSREKVIDKTIRQILPEIEANRMVETYSPVALDGSPVHIEIYSVFLNHWYEVYAHQTQPGHFAAFFTDITKRKDAEVKLRQLAYFPEEDPNPVLRCTPDGRIMYANVPAGDWLATFDRQDDGPAPLPEPIPEAVAEACRQNHAIEVEISNPAGRTFGITIVQPPGEAYVNLYTIDLTIRKEALESMERSNQELEHQLRNIEELNQSLQATNKLLEEKRLEAELAQKQVLHSEKLATIGKLSASIAHEFNNPLQGIMAILKGLKRRVAMDAEDAELLDLAIAESERMKKLIRDLQSFNRPSSHIKFKMNVHDPLEALLLMYKSDFNNKGITTVLNYAEGVPQILAIPDQIMQVFLNLLNNAVDACPDIGGEITISTWQEGKRIAVAIRDNGIGIEPEKIDLIFQPFYTTKSEVKGVGLGLSVCHGIVQYHQGEILVESKPGEGSIFTVLLPVNGK
jgi:PAS domain S-box-containing protein